MTDEELVALIKAGVDVKKNMEVLYDQCRGYIRRIAERYSTYLDLDDLMQEGYIALNNAVYDFNPSLGRFISYLYLYLKRQFEGLFLKSDSHGGYNKHTNAMTLKYLKLRGNFKTLYGREPSMEEYVAYLRLPVESILQLRKMSSNRNAISIECTVDEEDGEELTIEGTLSSKDNVENTVIDKLMNDDLKVGLWDIVKNAVNENEYSVVCAVYKFNMPLDKYASRNDLSRRVATNNFYSAMGKLKTFQVKKTIADRFEINYSRAFKTGLSNFKNTFTSSTEEVAIKNIENEINYISYVLTAVYDGISMLSPVQIRLALNHGLIDEDYQILVKWQIPKRGIASEKIEQYSRTGEFIKCWESVHDASQETGIPISNIRRCAKGTRETAGGFVWRKTEQDVSIA